VRCHGADNAEPREPLFGWRTLVAALSLYPIWIGLSVFEVPQGGWASLLFVLASLWTAGVVGWVGYRSLAGRLGASRWAALGRWFRWVRLPPFGLAYAISAGTLVLLVVWIVVDASFPAALAVAQESVGVGPLLVPGDMWMDSVNLAGRKMALWMLFVLAILSWACIVLRMFVGKNRGGRSLRGWMLVTLLVALWLGAGTSYERLQWWGMQQRLRAALPRFQKTAYVLLTEWPTDGTLPELGGYFVRPTMYPDLLIQWPPSWGEAFPMTETIAFTVSRSKEGALRFDLEPANDCRLEYHPPGSVPVSHMGPWGRDRYELIKAAELKGPWYLARYEIRDD
jgi:hypothetical protein